MSLKWIAYVAPNRAHPKGGSNTQNGRFPSKTALLSKKVCYKVSFCENRQRQSCKTFIGLSIGAKIVGEGRPLNLTKADLLFKNADHQLIFARNASSFNI